MKSEIESCVYLLCARDLNCGHAWEYSVYAFTAVNFEGVLYENQTWKIFLGKSDSYEWMSIWIEIWLQVLKAKINRNIHFVNEMRYCMLFCHQQRLTLLLSCKDIEKPASFSRWDSNGKKDEYDHRQLQVIQEFVVRFTHAYYNIVLLHILKTTRLCLTCLASTYSLTCCLE